MTQLLASVTNKAEAMLAMSAGADIIDLKNPAAGALGALPLAVIEEIVAAVDGLKPVSATIGDLPMQPALLLDAVRKTAVADVDFIKIGFFEDNNVAACLEALGSLATDGISLVAVLFADRSPDLGLLPQLRDSGFYGVMLDTCIKDGRNLLDHMSLADLQAFTLQARSHHLYSGLAGSLHISHVAELAALQSDYLGFRGALCLGGERKSTVSRDKVHALCEMLQKYNIPEHSEPKAQGGQGYALHRN